MARNRPSIKNSSPPPLPNVAARQALRADLQNWKYLGPAERAGLKNMLFAARAIVEGAYAGHHRSPYKGRAAEFVDYREYYPGDEIRTIDWKAFARTDRHFIKLFQRETDMACQIALDRSASMGYGGKAFRSFFPTAEISKLEYGSYLAAALAYLLVKQGDRVGLTFFDEKVTSHIPAGSTFPHLYSMMNALEQQKPGKKTSVPRALRDIFALHKRRGVLIVISDFLDDPGRIFGALDMFRHRRFEIILFHVLHRYEMVLPPLDSVHFVDAESGAVVTARPGDITEGYNKALGEYLNHIASGARARSIDYNLINTATPHAAALRKYMLHRDAR